MTILLHFPYTSGGIIVSSLKISLDKLAFLAKPEIRLELK